MSKDFAIKFTIIFVFLAPVFLIYTHHIYGRPSDEGIEFYLEKAHMAEEKGNLDEAILWYQKAMTIDPNREQIYTNVALLHERKGEVKKSAFYWMKRYILGKEDDFWTEKAREKLEKLGLLDKSGQKSIRKEEKIENRYSDKISQLQRFREVDYDSDKIENERKRSIKKALRNVEIELAIEYEMTDGEQSFRVITSGGQALSKLTYPIDGNMFILNGEVKFHPKFSIGGKYGASDFRKTTCSDEDWNFWGIHNEELKYIDYQITKQDCKSKMENFDINLYYRILDKKDIVTGKRPRNLLGVNLITLDIFAGYQQQKGRYTMQDPTTEYLRSVDDSLWQAAGLPLYEGLESPYKVTYRGPRLGLRLKRANKKLSTRISVAYAWIKTEAHGWWNLRSYSFSQHSSHLGHALTLDLDMRYFFKTDWFIGIGYNYTEYNQEKLKESGVQPGSTYDDLDIIRDVNNKVYGPSFIVGKMW